MHIRFSDRAINFKFAGSYLASFTHINFTSIYFELI